MNSYAEIAKMIRDKDYMNNIFIGEIISSDPFVVKVNGNDLSKDNILISDSINNIHAGDKVAALKYSTRLYIIIARVVKL
jgi:hypothetical protein